MSEAWPVYDEVCRIVGECCLSMAVEDQELSRGALADRVAEVQTLYTWATGSSSEAMALAIEQLKG